MIICMERGCVEDQPQRLAPFRALDTPQARASPAVLRLVAATQPRSARGAFGGSVKMRPCDRE